MKTLGIDPGSRLLGYGIVEKNGNKLSAVSYGTVKLNTKLDINLRLLEIHKSISTLIEIHQPDHVAIEKVFFAKNVLSALKLGQARGAAILAIVQAHCPIFEYSPNEIKMATVGFGHADKEQVAKMVSILLGVKDFESFDSSDGLAIAICHSNSYTFRSRIQNQELTL